MAKYCIAGDATLRGLRSLNAYRPCIVPFVTTMAMPKRCNEMAKYSTASDATLRGMWSLNAYRPCIVPFVTAMTMPKSTVQNGVATNQLLPLAAMRLKDWVSFKYLMSQPNNRRITLKQQ
jgi:hypothetical protein